RDGLTMPVILRLMIFFFQAEDGIRDRNVTGVQTCALPICSCGRFSTVKIARFKRLRCFFSSPGLVQTVPQQYSVSKSCNGSENRSEERRVGKECREGGGLEQDKEVSNIGMTVGYI